MATWLGGVLMLAVATIPRREPDELRTVLPVFSTVAFTSVALLAASGLYNAWRGIGTVNAIFTTTYGLLVVGKVALLAGVLLVANLSRRLVGRRVAVAYAMTDATVVADPAPALDDVSTERLRRAVIVEAVIALVVLALTSVLVNEPRGKEALIASYRKPVSAVAPLGAGKTVDVQASPGTHGAVTLTFALSDGSSPQSITATATQAAKQIGPLPISLRREGAGVYDGSANLPVGGKWQIDITVTRSTFDAITTDTTLNLH
jgi:copper transport protein